MPRSVGAFFSARETQNRIEITMTATLEKLVLKKQGDRRIRAGHQWIYSNEVDTTLSSLQQFSPGQQVIVENSGGKKMGIALMSPNQLICARLISRNADVEVNKSLIKHKLNIALSLRQQCFSEPYYRLCYGDSDGLPGLVVDRFADYLVIQTSIPGMDNLLPEITEALIEVLKPQGILLKNDQKSRETEGLESVVEVVFGDIPETVLVKENGASFYVDLKAGQKTGWFYDHRTNRKRLQEYAKGKRVLDLFSYIGAWGLEAMVAGADSLVCVDRSESALQQLEESAKNMGFADSVTTMQGNIHDALQVLLEKQERFDIVIVDPPAFIKKKKEIEKGVKGYQKVTELALRLLNKDGLLISASCSMHLDRGRHVDLVQKALRHVDRLGQIIEVGGQSADHPIHPAIVETDYLKSLFVRVLPAE